MLPLLLVSNSISDRLCIQMDWAAAAEGNAKTKAEPITNSSFMTKPLLYLSTERYDRETGLVFNAQ